LTLSALQPVAPARAIQTRSRVPSRRTLICHDRFTKRRRYQEVRVPLYWIVDGEARQVEVWTRTTSRSRFRSFRPI
jgi:hypothetical protein